MTIQAITDRISLIAVNSPFNIGVWPVNSLIFFVLLGLAAVAAAYRLGIRDGKILGALLSKAPSPAPLLFGLSEARMIQPRIGDPGQSDAVRWTLLDLGYDIVVGDEVAADNLRVENYNKDLHAHVADCQLRIEALREGIASANSTIAKNQAQINENESLAKLFES